MITHATPTALGLQSKLFRGFADASRLSILTALRDGPLTVSQLVESTGLAQSNVSNHLSCLRDCGLVCGSQQGRYVHYRLSDPRVAQLLQLADELLVDVATGVYECVHYGRPAAKTAANGEVATGEVPTGETMLRAAAGKPGSNGNASGKERQNGSSPDNRKAGA